MIGELGSLGAAICFSVAAVLYGSALQKTNPVSASIARCICVGAIMGSLQFLIFFMYGIPTIPLDAIFLAMLSGIIGLAIGDILYLKSIQKIGITRAVPITTIYPLFGIGLTVFLDIEPIRLSIVLGGLLVFVGLYQISADGESELQLEKEQIYKGIAYALLAAFVWSISLLFTDAAISLAGESNMNYAYSVNALRVLSAGLFLGLSIPFLDKSLRLIEIPGESLLALVVGGVISLGLGWFLLTFSFFHAPSSIVVPLSSTTPFFSGILGLLVLDENVTKRSAFGSLVVVLGIFVLWLF
ncbi:MAG: EamA family transporter [Candidatus Lokiarchaeota archaeon]|nr:EamA family transporter [Candidatus Lokiarchaeota archaeon]